MMPMGANLPVVTNSVPETRNHRHHSCGYCCGASGLTRSDVSAVTLSHLMAIYIHCRFGLLSALCGATIAEWALPAVLFVYGNSEQIGYAVNNMIGCVTGMLCDGAKRTRNEGGRLCNTAFLSHLCPGQYQRAAEGIVESEPAQTIRNFVRLGNDGSPSWTTSC